MAKSKEIAPIPAGELLDPADMVREQVEKVLERSPGLISFDDESESGQLLALRCAVDQGIPAAQRDGWRGHVIGWWVGTTEVLDKDSGEIITLPCVALLAVNGELCRLCRWPAINSWASIVAHMTASQRESGIPVRVYRRQSGTGGRSYWQVTPDACPSAPGS